MKYRYKRKPRRHQVAALKTLLSVGYGGALLMEPRTGKTQVSIDFASIKHQQGEVNRVLIVCPPSVMGVWEDEIEAVCPFPHRVVIWDRKGRKRNPLPGYGRDILDFVIMNYDAMSTPGAITGRDEDGAIIRSTSRGGRYDIKKAIKRWQPQLIIADEFHRIKSPSAKKSTLMHSLSAVAPYRIGATGTAVTKAKRIFDLYSEWKFLNPQSDLLHFTEGGEKKHHTSATFKSYYGVWKPARQGNYDLWIRNQNTDELRTKLHAESFAITRDECFDIPKTTVSIVPVVMSPYAEQVYTEMAETLVAQLKNGEITLAQLKIVLRVRLSQITSGFAKTEPTAAHPEGRLVRIDDAKLQVCTDILSDLFEADEKVIVAARFRPDIAAVAKAVARMRVRVWELHGGVDRADRDRSIKEFRAHQGPGVFILQPQVGSLGIDLSTAPHLIWYSLTDSYVDWTQTNDRNALSPRKTNTQYLLVRGSVDELKYESLQTDSDVVKMVQESPDRLLRNLRESSH